MKKNKKVLLTIITILISAVLFTNKVNAIVMWMQCTDNPEDEVETNNSDFKYYNTYAYINDVFNSDSRYLVFNPNKFYSNPAPVYVMYHENGANKNGVNVIGNMCWYNKAFDEIAKCNEDPNVDSTEMFNGNCPTKIYQTEGWQTSGGVKGDFLVLEGKKSAKYTESLSESALVIYGFENDDGETGIMIEGYKSSGLYGYASTWEDWKSFKKNLNLNNDTSTCNIGDWGCQLINKDEYDKNFMSWTAMTQARRVNKFGRDYFKLLDSSRPWIVGAVDDQKFTVTEVVDGKNVMYRSDDNNNKFYNWVSDWFEKYDKELSKQIEAVKNLKSEKYQKAYKAATEISKAVDEGKKYNFGDYSPSQMVLDLTEAYKELEIVLSNTESMYNYYDEQCNLVTNEKTSDALGAMTTQFNCEVFNVSSLNKLTNKVNPTMLNELIVTSLSTALNKHTNSDISVETLQSTAKEYAKVFAVAIKYINKSEALNDEANAIIKETEEKYGEMSKNLGMEVIIDCEDLIGEDLRKKIGSYLNIVKIAVPIILIGFGIIEFTKAIFAGDEDKMKKAQKNFLLRIGIAVIFFLTPTIVDFLLGLANKVWNFIEPGSCGIFNA